MLDEIWKDIVGFEGIYKISSKGRVLSLEQNDRGTGNHKEYMLSGAIRDNRLIKMNLINHDGKSYKRLLVELVIEHFNIEDPNTEIIYKDGNYKNCSVDNISFLSKSLNGFDDELWKPIPGYEETHELSSYGRLWHKPSIRANGSNYRGCFLALQHNEKTKSISCGLTKDRNFVKITLWKLMVLTFLNESPKGILYKDGNYKNCKINNLKVN